MYKACILDMDGTIINTLHSLAHCGNQALLRLGYPEIKPSLYKKMVGNGVYKLIERVLAQAGAENTPENQKKLYDIYTEIYEADPFYLVSAYEGMAEALQTMKKKGVLLAVLSNKPDNMTKFIAEKYFPHTFDFVQGQKDSIPVKPDPTALLSIIEHLKVKKEDVLYCGDSDVDMQTAKNAQVDSAGVLWGFRDREELTRNGAVYLAETPLDLCSLIQQDKNFTSMRVL